jgi:hypothetical protein
MFLNIIHHPVFSSNTQRFGVWILFSSSGEATQLSAIDIELVPISGHQHQHNVGHINQESVNHLRDLRQLAKSLKKNSTHMKSSTYVHALFYGYCCWYQSTIRREVITKEKNYQYGTNIKTQFSHIIYAGRNCGFLTSAVITRVQMGEMSKLGCLIGCSTRGMRVNSLYFLWVVFGSLARPSQLSNTFTDLLRVYVGLILIFQTDLVSSCICVP